jgi:MFS family permease
VSGNPLKTLRRHRDFRRLFFAAVVSDLGTWMQAVTVTVLVAEASHSSGATALVFSSLFFPQGLISPIGGLLADRFDRRHVAMTMQWIQGGLAGFLALLIHVGVRSPFALAGVVLLQGSAQALAAPSYVSMIPLLVPKDELLPALSLSGMTWNAGRTIGPALAAITAALWGPATSILGNACSFLVMALVVGTIKRPMHGGGHVDLRAARHEISDAAKRLWALPGPRTAVSSAAVTQLFMCTMFSTIPAYAALVTDSDQLPRLLYSAMGIGAIVGALSLAFVTPYAGRANVLTTLALGASAAILTASMATTSAIAVIALVGFGLCSPPSFILYNAVVQRDSPEQHRGRIMSIFTAVVGLTFGLFSVGMGVLADQLLGIRGALQISAVGLIVFAAVTRLALRDWSAHIDGSDVRTVRAQSRVITPAPTHE